MFPYLILYIPGVLFMFRDLFINACIIVSYIFLISRFVNNPFSQEKISKWKIGFSAGGLGLILMQFTLHVSQTTIVDLRHIAIIIPAVYLGLSPAVVASTMIAVGRLAFFDICPDSIKAAVGMFLLGIGCGLIHKCSSRLSFLQRWMMMNVFCMVTISILLLGMLGYNFSLLLKIVPYHWVFSFLTAWLAYYTIGYVMENNAMIRKLREESTTDFLTGLNNARQFDVLFDSYIAKAQRQQKSLSLLLLDIDHFKKVNDTYGHESGDEILRQSGTILLDSTGLGDIVSRNGGEEFSVVLLDRSKRDAASIAEHIRRAIEGHGFMLSNGQKINITVSIGVATYPETNNSNELFMKADEALYKAKNSGRNRVVVSTF